MATSSMASSSPSAGRSERGATAVVIAGILLAACVAVALALGGCKKILNGGSAEDSFHVRMLNLLEDSPTVQYSVDSTVITSGGYLAATGMNAAHPGDHTISFAVVRPASLNSSDTTDPIPIGGSFQATYAKDRDYTVFAYGTLTNPKTFTMDEQSNRATPADDNIEYQFVNASPNTPSADVYITAPEGNITSATKVATLAFGEKSTPTALKLFRRPDVTDTTASLIVDFTIELRDPASGAELFKSGKIRLTEQTRLLWAFANNIGPGPSKVKLVGIDGASGTTLDINDQAQVRVVHVSPDSPAFDIYQGSSLNTPIAANIAFRGTSPYSKVPVGDVDLIALPAGSQAITIVFVQEFTAATNASYSAYTIGKQGSVDAFVLADNRRSVPTQSSFRFFNAAPSLKDSDALDVYLTLTDQALDFTSSTSVTTDDAPQFKRGTIGYKGSTDSITLKSGTYRVRMTPTGTSRLVLDTAITVQDGSVQTFAVIDDPETASLELMPVEEALTQ
jgi:hypothetical protein